MSTSASFGPELIELLQRGAIAPIPVPLPSPAHAQRLRFRLHQLIKALERENSPIARHCARTTITITKAEPSVLVVKPADFDFSVAVLAALGDPGADTGSGVTDIPRSMADEIEALKGKGPLG